MERVNKAVKEEIIAVITLIEKKGEDHTYIRNLHPI